MARPFITADEAALAQTIADLAACNPFLPERVALEQRALGDAFIATSPVWHARPAPDHENPNITGLTARAAALADTLRARLVHGADPGAAAPLYADVVTYLLYHRVEAHLEQLIAGEDPAGVAACFARLGREVRHYLELPGLPPPPDPAHLFALFFQVRRAFHFTLRHILGGSAPVAGLRAAVWQAVFSRDMRRYRRSLYTRMHDLTTLIVGASGTGKELVAQAIGASRWIPFDARARRFEQDFRGAFFPLSLSALPATLMESELFGHARGAFTGAGAPRAGWLETCPALGTVFLDEIAEIDPAIQVKLLRVLQGRTFSRVGETLERRFEGKIVAATNRDLAAEMQAGRFRPDLYYRLCSVVIETPTLDTLLRADPGELRHLLNVLARRIAGDDEAAALAEETEQWIARHLGAGYDWPGNVRELEQCVRNVMVRGEYHPPAVRAGAAPDGPAQALARAVLARSLTADELLRRYCAVIYAETGSFQQTARRLGLDRRTVRDKLTPAR